VICGLACTLASGCVREPLDAICPAVDVGDLVITELRGPQSGGDTYGQWIEIAFADTTAGEAIDLAGLEVITLRLDGSGERRIAIRDSEPLAPGDYAVLGRFDRGAEPEHVDYGYKSDLDSNLYPSALVRVFACGVLIDQVVYRELPVLGTLALDGALAPTAEANDDEAAWCVDDVEDPSDTTALGIRGTPGERNLPCAN
jgi:hypothetical protein